MSVFVRSIQFSTVFILSVGRQALRNISPEITIYQQLFFEFESFFFFFFLKYTAAEKTEVVQGTIKYKGISCNTYILNSILIDYYFFRIVLQIIISIGCI